MELFWQLLLRFWLHTLSISTIFWIESLCLFANYFTNMIFRLDRFFLDEKDLFTFVFGLVVIGSLIFNYSLAPFRTPSLVVLFFFLMVTRSMVSSLRFEAYFFLTLLGLLFSLFLSPYGLAIYLFVAIIIYSKFSLVWSLWKPNKSISITHTSKWCLLSSLRYRKKMVSIEYF